MITPSCFFSLPSFFSTVTPGQFPTNWLEPVSELKSVVFPLFGFPAKAILISIKLLPSFLFNFDHFRICFAER